MPDSLQPSILTCVTDSPSARRVIQCSTLCAKAFGRGVRFVHFGELSASGAERLNEIIAAESGGHGLDVVPATRGIAREICDLAGSMKADLIVIGALQREAAMRDLVGSTARRVARQAPCSVMLVSTAGRSASQWTRYVVGVDSTPASRELAECVVRAARDSGPDAEVWFALEYRGYKHDSARSSEIARTPGASLYTAAEEYQLSNFINALDTEGIIAKAVTLPGRPGQEIARYAEDIHADMLAIVTPKRSLGFLDRLLSHPIILLLDKLPCSVLLHRRTMNVSKKDAC